MSAKNKIWQYLITHNNQATNAELADWLRGQKGQLSIGQRLREIRKDLIAKGGDLTCREIKTGIYLYKVIMPEPPHTDLESSIIHSNLIEENKINRQAFEQNGQMAFLR